MQGIMKQKTITILSETMNNKKQWDTIHKVIFKKPHKAINPESIICPVEILLKM